MSVELTFTFILKMIPPRLHGWKDSIRPRRAITREGASLLPSFPERPDLCPSWPTLVPKRERIPDLRSPIRFRPFLRPMVWGGRLLAEVLGKPLPTMEPY